MEESGTHINTNDGESFDAIIRHPAETSYTQVVTGYLTYRFIIKFPWRPGIGAEGIAFKTI
jgi:hypothetical protein